MTEKVEIKEIPKLVCISFVHDKAWLDFDNTFSVPLDKERLQELHRQCVRALEVFNGYKEGEIEEIE